MVARLALTNPRLFELGEAFADRGRQARLVGGAVRDLLLGIVPKDFDIATDADPTESIGIAEAAGYRVIPTGLRHGTVTIVVGGEPFEVTSLRRDVAADGRHAEVEFIRDFETDASRRDFTINAMSASLDGQVFDYFGGLSDLEAGRIRFVGSARQRVEEDYLRILRFFRFGARFGSADADRDAVEAIASLHSGLAHISGERIWQEMRGILLDPNGSREMQRMNRLGVMRTLGIAGPTQWQVRTFESVRAHGGGPAICLGALLASKDEVERIADEWRVSNKERHDATLAAQIVQIRDGDPVRWFSQAVDGMDQGVAVLVLAATGRDAAARMIEAGVPTFPLQGRDILAAGVERGPSVGRLLARAREAWKSSGYMMTADELLEGVGLATPRPPNP